MWRLAEPPLFTELSAARNVLIAGAGGGFDIYAGLPLALALHKQGKRIHLGSLSFADLSLAAGDVGPDSLGVEEYFPERTLARFLKERNVLEPVVHAFERTGVQPLRRAYRELVARHDIDAIVLVDGGTDILMRGDEQGLGTPHEDMASLAAVAGVPVARRFVVCLGFGIDAYHGVRDDQAWEAVAALEREGAYLGAFSLPPQSEEGAFYLDAVADAQAKTPSRPSIVHGMVAGAMCGAFGDQHFTDRTSGSKLFLNPLMAVYFGFRLEPLYRRLLYRARIENTETWFDMVTTIERFRMTVDLRPLP